MSQKTLTITFDPKLRKKIDKYLDGPNAKFKTMAAFMHFALYSFLEDEERRDIEMQERKQKLEQKN